MARTLAPNTRAAEVAPATGAATFSLARILGHDAYDTDPLSKTADTLKTYSGWVYAAVSTISADVRSSTWAIWEKAGADREDWKRLDEARVPPILRRPNATQTWGDLLELSQVHMDLAGKAFWHLITGPGSEQVVGLQILNPDWITGYTLDDTKTRQIGWSLQVPGTPKRTIPVEDVLHFRYPDPVDPFGGMSPVRAVALSFDMDTYSRAYGASHLRNHAQPTGLLTTESDLTREQAVALAETWKDTHLGSDSIQVLGKGAAYQPLSAMLRDLEFLSLARVSRDQILAAFHLPASRLGLIEDSSRANGEESDRVYSSLCLAPRLARYEEPITLRLLPRLGLDPARFTFEFDSVDVADKEFERSAAAEAFTKGAITLDEYRNSIGMGPEKNGEGNVYYMPIGAVVTDRPETGMAPFSATTPASPGEPQPEPTRSGAEVGEAGLGESIVPDLVLNGAQVTSLIQIVSSMLDGSLPYASALEIIQSAFAMSMEKAQRILGPESNAGSSKPAPAAPPSEDEMRALLADQGIEVSAAPSADRIEIASLRFLQGHEANERRMKAKLRKLFTREAKLMIEAAKSGRLRILKEGVEIRAAGDDVLEATADEWLELLNDEVTRSLRAGFDLFPADAGVGISFELVDERAVQYAAEHAGKVVEAIEDTTREFVGNLVRESVEQGGTIRDLTNAIGKKYDEWKGYRAENIARTETGSAMNAGKHIHAEQVAEEFPDMEITKTWSPTLGDERTREWHRSDKIQNERGEATTTVALDEKFSVGPKGKRDLMDRPHDPGASESPTRAQNIVNCRCVITYSGGE